MNLAEYLYEECIETGVEAADKPTVLWAIANLAKQCSVLKNVKKEALFEGLKEREELGSTGFGDGIAIPHCALEGIDKFVVGILVVPKGVNFDAIDGKPTKLFTFIIAPASKRNEHIRVLSSLSSVLRFPNNVKEILVGSDARTIRESFLRHSDPKRYPETKKAYQRFTVIVEREDVFHDVLTVLTEMHDAFVSVVEGSTASSHLYSLPLFAHFWNEEKKDFHRIIFAAVNTSLSNETIRKLNMIIENMEGESGVLLFVQDITYLNGSLNL